MINQDEHWLDFVVELNIEHFVYFVIHIDDLHKIECYWHLKEIKYTIQTKTKFKKYAN